MGGLQAQMDGFSSLPRIWLMCWTPDTATDDAKALGTRIPPLPAPLPKTRSGRIMKRMLGVLAKLSESEEG